MCGFNDLPDELLVKVLDAMTPRNSKKQERTRKQEGIRKQELCTLRLVSKRIDTLVIPQVFDTLRLSVPAPSGLNPSDCVRYSEIITALATSSPMAKVFEHTTMLFIAISRLFLDQEDEGVTSELTTVVLQARKIVQRYLFAAVAALRNLRSVTWVHRAPEPPDITTDFVRALSTLKSLKHFKFGGKIHRDTTISLQPLCNLHSVKIYWGSLSMETFLSQVAQLIARSPNLRELVAHNLLPVGDLSFNTLVLSLPRPLPLTKLVLHGAAITSDDVRNHMQHCHNLTTLVLTNSSWKKNSSSSSLWPCLRTHAIHLKSLSTDASIYPLLSDYLVSYTGLEELCLWAKDPADDSGDIVDRFYSILAHHHRTLKKVELRSPGGEAWAQRPTNAQLEDILRCRRLKELLVNFSFTGEELQSKNTTPVMIWLHTAMKLPELEHLRLCLSYSSLGVAGREAAMEFTKAILEEFEKDSKPIYFDAEIDQGRRLYYNEHYHY